MRPGPAAAVALALVAAGTVLSPTGAAAAGSCSIVAPTKVVLDSSYEEVVLRLGSDCAAADREYASWDIVDPSEGFAGIAIFDTNTVEYWDLYDWEGPARYNFRPSSAWDSNSVDLTQNTAYTTVKLGARITATVTRSSGRISFSAYASTYSPSASGWYKRAGANISLMHLPSGSSTWTWVKAAATSSSGRVTLSTAPKPGQYRLMVKETDKVWAGYSTTVRGA